MTPLTEYTPRFLHSVLAEVDVPVDDVEEGECKWEEHASILVDDTGASQRNVGRDC